MAMDENNVNKLIFLGSEESGKELVLNGLFYYLYIYFLIDFDIII